MTATEWVKATCARCGGTGEIIPAPAKPKLPANPIPCPDCTGGDADSRAGYFRGSGDPPPLPPPHAPSGGLEYHIWLEGDLPPGVEFPYGATPWLRAPSPAWNDSPHAQDGYVPSVLQELQHIDRVLFRALAG